MKYGITECDFYCVPTPKGAGADFDPVVYTRNVKKTTTSLTEVLNAMVAFNNTYNDVEIELYGNGFALTTEVGRVGQRYFGNREDYYTPKHDIFIEIEDD